MQPFACMFVSGLFVEKAIFSPLNGLGIVTENQLILNLRVYFWVLNSVAFCTSLLMLIPHNLVNCSFVCKF